MDVGYSGVWYTWERGNLPETNIRERLDKRVIEGWLNLFSLGNIHHLPYSTFDHCPLLINTDKVSRLSRDRNFHFEVWWTMEESFEPTLKDIWESSSEPLMEKLRNLQIGLSKWAHTIKGKKKELQKRLTKELEILMKEDRDDKTLSTLTWRLKKDEAYWEQRARVNWLRSGDRNTAYFHNCATARRLLEGIEGSISIEANEDLQAPFSEEEVEIALKGMRPTKAPGLDGFSAIFFQKYWHIVRKEVLDFCLGVLNEGKEVDSANMTNIVLIPKVQNPTSLVDFRLISLCSVLYKLVAKTIANRMQNVQSAFVPGRLISDNILLAYEILHTFRQKRTGKNGYMAVKLDMSKAYDRVEWDFIKEVMNKIGFARKWIELIMKCITSVSYTVLINGSRGRIFNPSRGLRQGDPLSLFYFLYVVRGYQP
ncbi:reverse transcriptase [Gossypium australe]|uniref:Reverse transcriptase n=1 Tax=Gossypium australe TaxID=47621 RepID=A0A5B6V147_9ROSI|nr:reverse transcriptase [Gossypium australe]